VTTVYGLGRTVRVLVVDDSAFARFSISKQLREDPAIEVVGVAADGVQALTEVRRLRPDVVTLDVSMPRMDGIAALERMMSDCPTPVVMVSALTGEGAEATIKTLELGAVDFCLKASPVSLAGPEGLSGDLAGKIKLAAAAKVPSHPKRLTPSSPRPRRMREPELRRVPSKVLVVGSSTGGPGALHKVVPLLPSDLAAAVLLVQHMPQGFTASLAKRLDELSHVRVKEARSGDLLMMGRALVAPGNYHLVLSAGGRVRLNQSPPVMGVRPSVDVTMESAAKVYGGSTVGVILTGMGSDGTRGAATIRGAGGRIVAEHESTCVVYGMPRSIVESGNADRVVPLTEMAEEIVRLCGTARTTAPEEVL